jgi:hypothetical protein
MVARVASFEGVNVEAAEQSMDEAEQRIRPLVQSLAGYQGHLELIADNGKYLSITLFDSDESAEAAEQTFDEQMPRELGDLYRSWGGRRVAVDRYRVLSEEHQ